MPSIDSTLIRLRDGRHLCVADLGDPTGVPVFFFHGGPGSRRAGNALDGKAREMGVRLLVPDRPGMGFSEPQPARRVLNWAADVEDVADALGIGRFGVFGASGGGPYALACAYALADRVTLTVAASCPGPVADDARMGDGYPTPGKIMLWAARRGPQWLVPPMKLMLRMPTAEDVDKPKSDKELAALADAPAWLVEAEPPGSAADNTKEVLRQGILQAATDLAVICAPWGFSLGEIRSEVHLWHGESDEAVPVEVGRHIATAIPTCTPRFEPGGHYIGLFRAEVIFQDLLVAAREPAPAARVARAGRA